MQLTFLRFVQGWLVSAVLLCSSTFANTVGHASNNISLINTEAPTMSADLVQPAAQELAFQTRSLVQGLSNPWSLGWLPNGDMLITERAGRLRRVSSGFVLQPEPIAGLPSDIAVGGQGGLFDVLVHPDHSRNGIIFLSYAQRSPSGSEAGTALIRARLVGNQLMDVTTLFSMQPKSSGGRHFGGRLAMDKLGHLYLGLGDRGDQVRAQQAGDDAGAVIRIPNFGSSPAEVFSRGHRNVQGMAIHPRTAQLWAHEHGPQGGDEVNIVRQGVNHGWPTITYGVNYVIGTRIGEGTHKSGMAQPVHVWVPSIAPSGMAFYQGAAFPAWRNSLLVGGLRAQSLVRLELNGDRVVAEHRLLTGALGRIRDVRLGPDGLVYLLTDSSSGELIRLEPR